MDTRAFHTHTGTYRVDTVVVRFYGNLGTLARYAGHGANVDEAVVDFGYFELEQAAQELLVGTAYGNLGVVVLVVDIGNYSAYGFAFAEEIAGN